LFANFIKSILLKVGIFYGDSVSHSIGKIWENIIQFVVCGFWFCSTQSETNQLIVWRTCSWSTLFCECSTKVWYKVKSISSLFHLACWYWTLSWEVINLVISSCVRNMAWFGKSCVAFWRDMLKRTRKKKAVVAILPLLLVQILHAQFILCLQYLIVW
jgi:hypothetical protein